MNLRQNSITECSFQLCMKWTVIPRKLRIRLLLYMSTVILMYGTNCSILITFCWSSSYLFLSRAVDRWPRLGITYRGSSVLIKSLNSAASTNNSSCKIPSMKATILSVLSFWRGCEGLKSSVAFQEGIVD